MVQVFSDLYGGQAPHCFRTLHLHQVEYDMLQVQDYVLQMMIPVHSEYRQVSANLPRTVRDERITPAPPERRRLLRLLCMHPLQTRLSLSEYLKAHCSESGYRSGKDRLCSFPSGET